MSTVFCSLVSEAFEVPSYKHFDKSDAQSKSFVTEVWSKREEKVLLPETLVRF